MHRVRNFYFLIASLVSIAIAPTARVPTVAAADRTAIRVDDTDMLNDMIKTTISNKNSVLILSQETYYIKKSSIVYDNVINGSAVAVLVDAPKADFTLDGNGSTFLMVGNDIPDYANVIEVRNAARGTTVTLKNITLAYATPPYAQATLVSMTPCYNGKGSATFQMQGASRRLGEPCNGSTNTTRRQVYS
jgi:hypothetical protein